MPATAITPQHKSCSSTGNFPLKLTVQVRLSTAEWTAWPKTVTPDIGGSAF